MINSGSINLINNKRKRSRVSQGFRDGAATIHFVHKGFLLGLRHVRIDADVQGHALEPGPLVVMLAHQDLGVQAGFHRADHAAQLNTLLLGHNPSDGADAGSHGTQLDFEGVHALVFTARGFALINNDGMMACFNFNFEGFQQSCFSLDSFRNRHGLLLDENKISAYAFPYARIIVSQPSRCRTLQNAVEQVCIVRQQNMNVKITHQTLLSYIILV